VDQADHHRSLRRHRPQWTDDPALARADEMKASRVKLQRLLADRFKLVAS
jgi:hypothetical protein